MEKILKDIIEKNRKYTEFGHVADYIPELKKACKGDLGICIIDKDNNIYTAGDVDKKFTIQSISKPILLSMILMENKYEYVNTKVGFEPSENPFNSIVSIGNEIKKPSNPMINSGAIVITSMIKGNSYEEKEKRMLDYFRKFAGNESLDINQEVYTSEKLTGDRNRAMAYLLKSSGFIDGDIEEILDLYFKQCSIEADIKDLAKMGLNLSTDGYKHGDEECLISKEVAKAVKTVMFTCGMYDGSGEFAIKTGIPAKSGVGGGIMASVPCKIGIGVYGPSLNDKGNSVAGIKVLEDLSKELDLGIFKN
jgi:glutaminase